MRAHVTGLFPGKRSLKTGRSVKMPLLGLSCTLLVTNELLVQIYISLIRCAHLRDIELNTERKIPYLPVHLYYTLYLKCPKAVEAKWAVLSLMSTL